MPLQIPLQAIPNQSFSVALDGVQYNFIIKASGNVMTCTVAINNVIVISGVRILPQSAIIPYPYLSSANFFMSCTTDDYPYWPNFNVTQFLVYSSAAEVEAAIASST